MTTGVLCARLFGPLASWGTAEAGSATRPSGRHPARGALLGLAAAALGIRRDDEARQMALGQALLVAVASHGPRRVASEYRTVQTIQASTKVDYATRAEALQHGHVHTSTSTRQHIEDGLWRIFLAVRPGARFSLDALAIAFARPSFELYLGRREFPLALPPDPVVIPGGLQDALGEYPAIPSASPFTTGALGEVTTAISRLILKNDAYDLAWDSGFPGAPASSRTRQVIDDPYSRNNWRFRPRTEHFTRQSPPRPEKIIDAEHPDLESEFFPEEARP